MSCTGTHICYNVVLDFVATHCTRIIQRSVYKNTMVPLKKCFNKILNISVFLLTVDELIFLQCTQFARCCPFIWLVHAFSLLLAIPFNLSWQANMTMLHLGPTVNCRYRLWIVANYSFRTPLFTACQPEDPFKKNCYCILVWLLIPQFHMLSSCSSVS